MIIDNLITLVFCVTNLGGMIALMVIAREMRKQNAEPKRKK